MSDGFANAVVVVTAYRPSMWTDMLLVACANGFEAWIDVEDGEDECIRDRTDLRARMDLRI